MDDIVTQLQRTKFMQHADIETLCDQAAAEIKRLRHENTAMRRQALQNIIEISENADMYNLH